MQAFISSAAHFLKTAARFCRIIEEKRLANRRMVKYSYGLPFIIILYKVLKNKSIKPKDKLYVPTPILRAT